MIETGGRLFLLFGQLIGLILCIGYIQNVYNSNIFPDKNAKDYFQQTNCFIISERLSTKGRIIHQYRADFLISYTISNEQYTQWVSGNGLDIAFTRNREEQENLLAHYRIGRNYPCWYNPENPTQALLVLRHNWLGTFPLIIPSIVAVILLYYFLKNLSQLSAYARMNVREVKRRRKI